MLENRPLPRDDVRAAHRLARLTLGLVALTTGLIVLGALVRAHGAGLACPDWPLCFGQVVPEMDVQVAFEWTHRLVAGSVAASFGALCIALLRRPALRREASPLWWIAALVLATQVLLGALTVWHLLARWTVTAHLVTGNGFNACLLLLALRLRETGRARSRAPLGAGARSWTAVAPLLLAAQIVLGGLVASGYAGLACTEWPACRGGVWFPTFDGVIGLQLAHRLNGYALFVGLAAAAWTTRGVPRLGTACALALALGGLQIVVGVLNVLWRLPVEITGLHSALAAALVLVWAFALRERRLAAHAG